MNPDALVTELKLELPPAPKPMGVYRPCAISGGFAFVSGHGPLRTDKTLITGKVGNDLDVQAAKAAEALSETFAVDGSRIEVWLDIDCGMHRTGMAPGPEAIRFYRWLESLHGLKPVGLHAYGGHVHESDPQGRAEQCDAAFAPVTALRNELERQTTGSVRVIADGAPTFAMQSRRGGVECSPGTCLLWDFGYADRFPDLDFLLAALVLTRVVSKPGTDRLCLDLGHKAIAAENPHPRVRFPELPDAEALMHSEEHLVIRSSRANEFAVGDVFFGIPRHICPTVALYAEAVVIRGGQAVERWKVAARESWRHLPGS